MYVMTKDEGAKAIMSNDQMGARIWEHRVSMLRLAVSIMGSSQDAEDAVSDAVVKALTGAEKLRNEAKLKPWLLSITAHRCYDLLRRRKRVDVTDDIDRFDTPVFDPMPDDTVLRHILRLPDALRQVLVLYYYEGYRANEIAGILGIPISTVLMRMSRGRQKLKQAYEQEGGDA